MQRSASDRHILPVNRTREQARRFYDRVSRIYDCISGPFERRYAFKALNLLAIRESEAILEIGFGTGHCLERIAVSVGETGKAFGIDISPGMVAVAGIRLKNAHLLDRVELICGDATNLPYKNNVMDGALLAFTLELFNTPDIPRVLEEVKRILKPEGRIAVTSLSKITGESLMVHLYEWVHTKWPEYADCRPIFLEESIKEAGYNIKSSQIVTLFGLPVEIVIALNK